MVSSKKPKRKPVKKNVSRREVGHINRKLYKNLKLVKTGEIIEKGTPVTLSPIEGEDGVCRASINGHEYRVRWTSVLKPPSEASLERNYEGCNSVAGKGPIEPDGHDDNGFPSWLLALGMI